jgi:hypothetical protein
MKSSPDFAKIKQAKMSKQEDTPPTEKPSTSLSKTNENVEKQTKIPKWKIDHQNFIENIRFNKKLQEVNKSFTIFE